jgi:hypothetical protein
MKLTIIPIDNAVYKDSVSYFGLDLSSVPNNVHALQWENTAGWIEFLNNDDGTKPLNEPIIALPDWANVCLTKWNDAKTTEEAVIAAAKAYAAANQPQTTGTQTA